MKWLACLTLLPALALASDPPAKAPEVAAPVIVIDQMAFVPEVIEVKAGTEVTWRNKDGSVHTVTGADGSFGSSPLAEGAVYRHTFAKPGTYAFSCEMHPFMSGKIVVK